MDKDDDKSDNEEEKVSKDDKKSSEKKEEVGYKAILDQYFFNPSPNGGRDPDFYSLGYLMAMLAGMGYLLVKNTMTSNSKEVTYIEFINDYLAQNQVSMITIGTQEGNDLLKYKVEVKLENG